jgi:hyperosmotically inducible periplasmic protein
MPRFSASRLAAALLAVNLFALPILAQETQPPAPSATFSDEDGQRVVQEVRRTLARLTTYGVFDWITFGIHGKNIILNGYASRPILRSDAERAVRRIQGVAGVENNIVVLPNSPMDDRIRAQVYNRIYTNPVLRRYNANRGSIGRAIGPGANVAVRAGGVTQSPPIGFHAIHIVVRNGHVTLFGNVDNEMASNVANIQANGTPGVFSVENNLSFPGQEPPDAKPSN